MREGRRAKLARSAGASPAQVRSEWIAWKRVLRGPAVTPNTRYVTRSICWQQEEWRNANALFGLAMQPLRRRTGPPVVFVLAFFGPLTDKASSPGQEDSAAITP
jgi:hypothetical protein